jgi:NitT/TauT family transport system substrate-binding protein
MKFILLIAVLFSAQVSEAKIRLALNWKPEPQFGGFYAAQENGEFKKRGLDVEVLPGGAGTPVIQMIGSGAVEYGIVSGDEIVIARSKGMKVIALFATYQTHPQGVMSHAERGFNSLKDVYTSEGTLALQQGLPYALLLKKKYPQAKAKIVPYLGGISNFLSDKNFSQQVFVTSEPLIAKQQKQNVSVFLVAEEGFNPYATVLAVKEEALTSKPKEVKAMVDAVRAGWVSYMAKPESTNKFMSQLNKAMSFELFQESEQAQRSLIETAETKKTSLGMMTEARWKQLVDQLIEVKLIAKPVAANELFKNL